MFGARVLSLSRFFLSLIAARARFNGPAKNLRASEAEDAGRKVLVDTQADGHATAMQWQEMQLETTVRVRTSLLCHTVTLDCRRSTPSPGLCARECTRPRHWRYF